MKSLLLLASLIFSEASVGMPAPYAFSEPYSSFEAGELQSEVINGKKYYKSDIKNVGNNYLDISGCSLEQDDAKNEAISAYSEVIAPGKSKTVYFESNYEDKTFAKENIKAKAYANAVRDLIDFKDFGTRTVEIKQGKNYYGIDTTIYQYFFEVNFEISKDFDTYYSLMFTVNYNGEDHSYYQYDFNKEENPYKLRFKSEENLDINSIEIKDIFLLEGNSYYKEFIKEKDDEALKKGLIAGAVALLFVGLVVGIVFIFRRIFSRKHA